MRRIYNGIEELVGNTPMIRLGRMFPGHRIYAKLEYYSPTLSVKDRAAFHMVRQKLQRGELKSGDWIIEATSGNTGLGLCAAALVYGLRFIAIVFDDISPEKISMLKNYGALVIVCDGSLPSDGPGGYVWTAQAIARQFPNVHYINQFSNPDNPGAHMLSTGPEIWEALGEELSLFVNTVGTGGTVTGISRYLKGRNPEIRTVAVEPTGGIYQDWFHGRAYRFRDHLIHSISDNFISPNFDRRWVDAVEQVPDEESFGCCLELMRTEGLCVGTSAGCTVAAIRRLIEKGEIRPDTVTVCTLADSGLKYCDSLLSETFLRAHSLPHNVGPTLQEQKDTLLAFLDQQQVKVQVI